MYTLIFALGLVLGWLACLYAPRRKNENKYEKYKNNDGLYSRKIIKGR